MKMVSEPLISDPVDPLHAFSGISLFHRSIRASTDVALPSDPNDLDSIHNFMKYLTMSSPERILDEAKTILDGGSELLNSQFSKFAESIGIDKDAVSPEGKEKPLERRRGLGRKRARFFLKPNTSQPSASMEPSLDIDQLQDPEEFFSAYEKLENAKREIQKQKGSTASYLNENYASTNTRHRRPGILGKSASYKHRYSSVLLETDGTLTSSQETFQQDVLGARGHGLQEDTSGADVETEEIDVVGSITTAENRFNEILDELLSKDGEDLDEDGALSLLQERLQIKPIDLGNLSIPDCQGIGRTDFKALGERLPKARKSVSNMSNLVKQLTRETPRKHNEATENPINPIASPTPPRSPFASLSLLKMHNLQSNQLRDPFSPLNVDFSEPRNPFSVEDIDKQSDQVDVLKELSMSGKSRSEMEDETDRPSVSDMDIHTLESRGSQGLIADSVDKNLERQIRDIESRRKGSQMDLRDNFSGNEIHKKTMDCDTKKGTETNGLTTGPDKMAENIGDVSGIALSYGETHLNPDNSAKSGSSSDVHMYQSSQVEGMPSEAAVPAGQDVNIQNSTIVESMNGSQPLSDQLTLTASEEYAADMPSTTAEINPAKNIETHLLQKQQRKEKRPRGGSRESKAFVLRPSLAVAGTSFESGVRRSKRIRTRPLEYWRGERFLYGRIDKSLKLIGVKYTSPSKGDGSLTVKSYVPDEYKEIVQLAALY